MALLLRFPNNLSIAMTCISGHTPDTHAPPKQIQLPESFGSLSDHSCI